MANGNKKKQMERRYLVAKCGQRAARVGGDLGAWEQLQNEIYFFFFTILHFPLCGLITFLML